MSWNEQKGDRDPWKDDSRRSPDLDEFFRRLQKRLGRFFQRRPGPGKRPALRLWWLLPFVLAIIWLATGFYRVPAGSKAVQLRFGHYAGIAAPGLHWHGPWPFAGVEVVDVSERRSVSQRAQLLTADGQLATIELTLNYHVADPYAYAFGATAPVQLLSSVASAALARAARDHPLDELSGKDQDKVAGALQLWIVNALAGMHAGIEVDGVELKRAALPTQVDAAHRQLAATRASAAAAATAAGSAAAAAVAAAEVHASAIVAAAEQARTQRIAEAHAEVARFEALIPSWKKSPQATQTLLRQDVMTEVLTSTPKVVIAGSIHTVQLPPWPATAAATAKTAAKASASAAAGASAAKPEKSRGDKP